MKSTCLYVPALFLLCLLAAPASAQTESISMNFGKIEMSLAPSNGADLLLELDLTLEADGSVSARIPGIHKVSNVTLKRGVIGSEPPSTWLSFLAIGGSDPEWTEPLGQVLLELPESDAEYHIDLPPLLGDGSVRFVASNANPGSHVQLRFDPVRGGSLVGSPARLFNRPGPDAPLVAQVPVPNRGQSIDVLLTVTDPVQRTAAPGTKVRVRIHHSI